MDSDLKLNRTTKRIKIGNFRGVIVPGKNALLSSKENQKKKRIVANQTKIDLTETILEDPKSFEPEQHDYK